MNWLLGKKKTWTRGGDNVKKGKARITTKDGKKHDIDVEGWGFWDFGEDFKRFRNSHDVRFHFDRLVRGAFNCGYFRISEECVLSTTEVKGVCLEDIKPHHDHYEVTYRVGGIFKRNMGYKDK